MRMFRLAFLVLSLGLVPQAECSPDWPVLKTYEGEYLRKVKMPLGGIGTGTISLSGRGGLVDWEIQNSPAKGFTPNNAYWPPTIWPFFAIRTETAAGAKSARLLEGPLSLDEYEGDMGSRAPNHGFPRFRKAVFKTAYPFAQVSYVDPAVPLEVTLQAMNPLVPGDAEASGIPAILLRWRLKNVTERPIRASVVGMVPNICGLAPGTEGGDDVAPRHASRRNANGLSGVVLAGASAKSAPNKVTHPSDGELALLAPDGVGAITSAIDLRDPGWGVSQDRFWTRFLARGDVGDTTESAKTAYNRKHAAQLCVAVEVPPMATADVPFVLCWRFPNRMKWYWDKANPTIDQRVGNWYATRYASAAEAGERLWRDLPALEAKTLAFVRGVLAASAPDVVKEAALFNLSTLRSETCFRTENGDFFGWEGTTDTYGSCFGSCTHVWG